MCGVSRDQIKSVEYGISRPSLTLFLSAAASLGISPTDLCRVHEDDEMELEAGRSHRMQRTTTRTP